MSAQATEPVLEAAVERHVLQKLADALNGVGPHVPVGITPGGLAATTYDPPNIYMVVAELPAAAFRSYDARERVVGLPVEWLAGVCRDADGASVRLAVDATTIRVANESGEYAAPLVEPDGLRSRERLEYDDEFDVEVTLTGRQFRRVAVDERPGDAPVVEVTSTVTPEGVAFQFWDSELDGLLESHEFNADDAQALAIEEHGSALYSASYFGAIANAVMASPPVTLRFAEDFPLCVRYPLTGVWSNEPQGYVEHWLAPRIRDGDNR